MSSSCSATMIQESVSSDEIELLSFNNESLGEFSMSVVHCTSGVMPTRSMSCRAGDRYFATVTIRADPSWSSVTLCIKTHQLKTMQHKLKTVMVACDLSLTKVQG